MNATIHLTDRDTKFIIHNLYPLYLHDLSEIWGWTPNAYGVFEDGPTLTLQEQNQEFAVWWEHPGVLYPYLIRADGIPAGFALVAAPPYAPPGIEFYLNEFFVLRSFRGKGIAKSAAMQVFDAHAGAWELQTNPTEINQRAQAFWRKTLQSYTAGAFRTHVGESGKDGVKWIFRFQNGGGRDPLDRLLYLRGNMKGEDAAMSRDYEQVAEKFWSLPQKPGEEVNRDRLFRDDQILHAHLEREIESRLDGVKTVLDAGGGTGRFSVWLAQKGLQVTHLDISLPMLEKARERAEEAGVSGQIEFVHGRLTELASYRDGQFDLVISLDAPISYTYPKHEEVIRELIRVSARSVVFCVSSRLGGYPGHFGPASKKPFLVDEQDPDTAVRWYVREWAQREQWQPNFGGADVLLETGLFDDPDKVYAQMERGGTPWPVTYSFRPEEMKALFADAGLREVRLAGPGALARSLPGEALRMLLETQEYRAAFLERCYRFDSEPSVCGMGYCSLVASGSKG